MTLESPLDCKEIQPVHSEGDQPWDFFGRNDAKAETPVLWPPPVKSWTIGKDSDARRDCGQEEKGTTEDEMAGWHHWLNGCESKWTLGVGDGQGGLACCDSWGRRVGHDWATELNWGHHLQDGVIGCGCSAAFPFKYPMPELALFEGEHILGWNTFAGERLDFRNGKIFLLLLTLPCPSFFLPFGETWMYT